MENENKLKHLFKNKVRVTTSTLVGFLIMGGISFASDDQGTTIKEKNYIVMSTAGDNNTSYTGGDQVIPDLSATNQSVHILESLNGIYGYIGGNNNGNISINSSVDGGFNDDTSVSSSESFNGIYSNIDGNNNGNVSTKYTLTNGTTMGLGNSYVSADYSGNGVLGNIGKDNNGNILSNGNIKAIYSKNVETKTGVAAVDSGNGILGSIGRDNNGNIISKLAIRGGDGGHSNNYEESKTLVSRSGNGVLGNIGRNNNGNISSELYAKGIAPSTNSNIPVFDNIGKETNNSCFYPSTLESGNGILGNIGGNNNGTIETNLSGRSYFNAPLIYQLDSGNGILGNIGGDNIGLISATTKVDRDFYSTLDKFRARESGNGILGNINKNTGMILSNMDVKSTNMLVQMSGNGVLGDINKNLGIISANRVVLGHVNIQNNWASLTAMKSSNGIVGNINENKGVISGYNTLNFDPKTTAEKDIPIIINIDGGNGIVSNGPLKFSNIGVVKGSNTAIYSYRIGKIKNIGILAGKNVISGNGKSSDIENTGTFIKFKSHKKYHSSTIDVDANDNPVIDVITVGNGGKTAIYPDIFTGQPENSEYTVYNGDDQGKVAVSNSTFKKDTYLNLSEIGNNKYPHGPIHGTLPVIRVPYKNLVINGSGIDNNHGALIADKEAVLLDSIINSYGTALHLKGKNKFTARNVIFNGGGLKNNQAVITGDNNSNTLEIEGTSIINGNVDLKDGNDTLTIRNGVTVNGDLNGGSGADELILGGFTRGHEDDSSSNLNIYKDIKGFDNITINKGTVKIFETSKIDNGSNISVINLNNNGQLIIPVNGTSINPINHGKVTQHALFTTGKTKLALHSNGGQLILGLNGIGNDGSVDLGNTTLDKTFVPNKNIKTDSLVTYAKNIDSKDGHTAINFAVKKDLSLIDEYNEKTLSPKIYGNLNEVYHSIVSSGQIGALSKTTEVDGNNNNEKTNALYSLLDQVYSNNPYSYTLKASRDGMKLFENNMDYLTISPKTGETILQGKVISTGVKNDTQSGDTSSFNIDHKDYKTTTNTNGGIATYEYGLDENNSIGVVLGGNTQNINLKGASKVKGNSVYAGAFTKHKVDKFNFKTGIGYQYSSFKADRTIANNYDIFKSESRYGSNGLNAFAQAKYELINNNNWKLEPKAKLSYYHIDQDGVKENYNKNTLNMETNKVSSNTADITIGLDLIKIIPLESYNIKNILSLNTINTLGNKDRKIEGCILGNGKTGSTFDIGGTKLPNTSGKIGYNIEIEQVNGVIYSGGISLEFAKGHNKNLNMTLGLGYKF